MKTPLSFSIQQFDLTKPVKKPLGLTASSKVQKHGQMQTSANHTQHTFSQPVTFSARQWQQLNGIRFGAQTVNTTQIQVTLKTFATQLLQQQNLQPGQKLYLKATSDQLPLVRQLVEVAYRDFQSGLVVPQIIEPEFEALKGRYGKTAAFDFMQQRQTQLQAAGAATLDLSNQINVFGDAGLTALETNQLKSTLVAEIPTETQALLNIEPDEILEGCLNLRPGQPLVLTGMREHLPNLLKLAERAYQKGTDIVQLKLMEDKAFDLSIPFYQFAPEALLSEVPTWHRAMYQEYVDKNVARVYLDGEDPSLYEGLDGSRISRYGSTLGSTVKDLSSRLTSECPWTIYYAPTTISAKAAGYERLEDAARDARKINRLGGLQEHIANLEIQTERLNILVKQGYRTLHFESVDPNTGQPDGKTNLKVGLTPKSIFMSAQGTTPSGQKYMANVPSEESFSTPDWTQASGWATMTRPISLNGVLVDGARFEFENGKLKQDESGNYTVTATQNQEALRAWLKENENADKLGEIALVANSPIFNMGRVFNSILIDENATCHMAFGSSYAECVEGALEIQDYTQRKAFLDNLNCNDSPTHYDFMIGGPHVRVTFERESDGDKKVVVENNEFQNF
jgi:aminopeptidase